MLCITLTDAQLTQLTRLIRQAANHRVRQRSQALVWSHQGKPRAEIAQLFASEKLIYRWKDQQKNQLGKEKASRSDELDQVKAQLKRVEMERDILKKALILFGQPT